MNICHESSEAVVGGMGDSLKWKTARDAKAARILEPHITHTNTQTHMQCTKCNIFDRKKNEESRQNAKRCDAPANDQFVESRKTDGMEMTRIIIR